MTQYMEALAEKIQLPLDRWAGNCYSVACQLTEKNLVEGKPVYGLYFGPISAKCEKFAGRPFTHHGWIVRGRTLRDPTRWVFEARDPYLFVSDVDDTNYDAGGNWFRTLWASEPRPFCEGLPLVKLPQDLDEVAKIFLAKEYRPEITVAQLGWLASMPLQHLQEMAEPLFRWIIDEYQQPGLIPIDNRREVLGE